MDVVRDVRQKLVFVREIRALGKAIVRHDDDVECRDGDKTDEETPNTQVLFHVPSGTRHGLHRTLVTKPTCPTPHFVSADAASFCFLPTALRRISIFTPSEMRNCTTSSRT